MPAGEGRRGEEGDMLLTLAREAMGRAYAPYSGVRVGAALEDEDGRSFGGCNLENASYPVGLCAERVALGCAVAAGARQFRRLVISANGNRPASPCGMCRQALAEFGLDLEIESFTPDGTRSAWSLHELLPATFVLEAKERAAVDREDRNAGRKGRKATEEGTG